ncbi:MAG: DNA gyrase inhibitor YacG [Candidatus Binataceae bacterium]
MRCPICKKPVDAAASNRFRPFCSERCRTMDLGAWAVEGYRVHGAEVEDHEHPSDHPDHGGKKKIVH